ncbi:MAG TPA: PDDEXK nuclease domain-containing protein [Candidatus Babeliales bacterium]|nr:PDDEXK nuclease domain-containing protein [Candidatus Babeliales bacterium]
MRNPIKKNKIIKDENIDLEPKQYAQFLDTIKQDIAQTQLKATLSVTQELWHMEKVLLDKIASEGWGVKITEKILLELGQGFSFVGQQYHVEVGEQDFYIDLLFYHLTLRCFIVVELKNTEFIPEYAGKLNFYLSAIDDLLRIPSDQPTIGLLLCRSKNNYVAEYALRDIKKPIGISSYTTKLVESLPKEFKGKLPSIEEIEAGLKKLKKMK